MTNEKFATRKELEDFRQEVRVWLQDVLGAVELLKGERVLPGDLPPSPPKISRKFAGSKGDIRARIDRSLYNLLIAEAMADCGGNVSKMLDIILWRYYKKPKMSWEGKGK